MMLLQANALQIPLKDASVQCCVTSPPYWGLRDYGIPPIVWGGDPACEHEWEGIERIGGGKQDGEGKRWQHTEGGASGHGHALSAFCIKCRAWMGCLGLEPTPEMFVSHLVEIFREVRRVLREDGTLFLNLGDTYLAGKPRNQETCESGGMRWSNEQSRTRGNGAGQRIGHRSSFRRDRMERQDQPHKSAPALKPKDLVGIPWMAAFALRADGWYLRSEITLCKRNPMPESVTDRPTSATEKLFLLTKNARYFYDADAVRESSNGQNAHDLTGPGYAAPGQTPQNGNRKSGNLERKPGCDTIPGASHVGRGFPWEGNTRNLRNWWEYVSTPFPDAHFATFSPDLPKRCILAGTSARGACAKCGAPWARVVEKTFVPQQDVSQGRGIRGAAGQKPMDASNHWEGVPRGTTPATTTGWRSTCSCSAPTVPCVVLDPFGGSMTTVAVAESLGRCGIGMDLKPEYLEMGRKRVRNTNRGLPLFSP